ncbi:MAG TPA: PilZ domain-containing protein [Candidatus Dormibacteraeota bacterium]|nr:PilZ domain-containing protein [Candidatus Dormibacteraeota bacterium]
MEAVQQKERRGAARFMLALPIVVHRIPLRREGDLLYGKTRDISTSGLYFTTYESVDPGTKFELSFSLPLESTDGTQILITLQASAVRIVTQSETVFERVGVGAVIEKFQILQADREPPK